MTLTSPPFTHPLPHLVFPPLRTQCAHLPAASCAFSHHLFLTSYMISSKFICDNAYSNKVSVSYKQLRSQQLIMSVLVPILLSSAPVTVDSHFFSFSNPHRHTLRIP